MKLIQKLVLWALWLAPMVHATDPYRATHAYFASRTLDTQSIVVILVMVVLLTFFAVYIAVNALHDKFK
jgi:hypothetical protein